MRFDLRVCRIMLYDLSFYDGIIKEMKTSYTDEFYFAVKKIRDSGEKVSKERLDAIYSVGDKNWDDITSVSLVDTEVLAREKQDVYTSFVKDKMIEYFDNDFWGLVANKSNVHMNVIKDKLEKALYYVDTLSGLQGSKGLENVRQRLSGFLKRSLTPKTSLGEELFDRHRIQMNAGELSVIFGATGIGKSKFSLYLANRLAKAGKRVLYINLEMSEDVFIRQLAMMQLMDAGTWVPPDEEEGMIMGLIEEKQELLDLDNIILVSDPSMKLSDVDYAIKSFAMGGEGYVFVDLLSMVSDYGKTPQEIEESTNKIHQIAKRHNVHLLGVLQANRNVEEVKKYNVRNMSSIPSIQNVKNSSAPAERARLLLGVSRRRFENDDHESIAQKHIRNNSGEKNVDCFKDVFTVHVIKNSYGEANVRLNYFADMRFGRFLPYE